MGVKLNARQQAQLAYLQGLTPKFQKIHSTIELMANMQADESVVRSFGRTLDEIKSGAGQMQPVARPAAPNIARISPTCSAECSAHKEHRRSVLPAGVAGGRARLT